ncbi:MAG: S41 family peptidase [Bacteroidota bacterium]
MRSILLIMSLGCLIQVAAQDCDCKSNFEWLKTTFEENDAGFTYALEQKGEEAYQQHNSIYKAKVKKIKNPEACWDVLYDWLTFFRSGHIDLQFNQDEGVEEASPDLDEDDIRSQYRDWETFGVDLDEFKAYLKGQPDNPYEGIWSSPPYEIGIKQQGEGYIGFIIEADGVYWTKEQVKLKIHPEGSATFYMRDHSPQEFAPEQVKLVGNNLLQMDFVSLKRVFPARSEKPEVSRYMKAMQARAPYFERINASTVMLRIPSFSNGWKPDIDSVILANRETILQSPHLIIDLRNNGGGSDGSFQELLPILYTNPIRTVGVEFRSTPLNNQRMLDFITNPEYNLSEEDKKWAQEAYDKLTKREGEFVMLNEYPVSETTFDTVYSYPENVAILINEGNGSTTEQFLLAAKQSSKVKLFGTTTYGVLDISNMHAVTSPCGDLTLGYSLSRSMRIPAMTIDDKGIQPDYYIDRQFEAYQWIDYAVKVLEY